MAPAAPSAPAAAPSRAVDWWRLASNVPCSLNEGDSTARQRMFRSMDFNGNGLLAVTEVQRFLKKLLGELPLDAILTAVRDAFDSAKAARHSDSADQNQLLDLLEFRQFLGSVKSHFFERFLEALAREGDGYMDLKQFTRFVRQMQNWGVDADPVATAQAIVDLRNVDVMQQDRIEHAVLQWTEVENWARGARKDFDEAALTEEERSSKIADGIAVGSDGTVGVAGEATGATAAIDLPSLVSQLPCSKYSSEVSEARKQLWNRFDASGNGVLTPGEILGGLIKMFKSDGDRFMSALSPAINRAFSAAKGAVKGNAASGVTRGEEFRLLLVYLKRCARAADMRGHARQPPAPSDPRPSTPASTLSPPWPHQPTTLPQCPLAPSLLAGRPPSTPPPRLSAAQTYSACSPRDRLRSDLAPRRL